MNKTELIEAVAERAELSKAAVNKAIDALTDVITSVISKGNPVALIGFGTFKSVMRSARTGKNPKTGAVLKIAAKAVPKFSATVCPTSESVVRSPRLIPARAFRP